MTIEAFIDSINDNQSSAQLNPYLLSLWHDKKNNWEDAHSLIQDLPDQKASLVHAYLHRKEGDVSNAKYWYQKAGRMMPECSLEQEWENLVSELLS